MKKRIRILTRRVIEKPRKREGSFVVEASIERSEELRVDRLGPEEDDVQIIPSDRPVQTLD